MNGLTFAKAIKYIEGYDFESFFNEYNVYSFLNYLDVVCDEYREGKWHFLNGASKMVFLFDDEDYVIKIPFNSVKDWNNNDYRNYSFIYFYNAPTKSVEDGWDYCKAEEDRYDEAAAAGFSEFLAQTKKVYVTNNGIRIYIQPKCSEVTKVKTTSKKTYKEFMIWYNNQSSRLPIDNEEWLNLFIDNYGENKLRQFLDFLSKNEWDDDLTSDNIGYLNNKPVLIDYCGYWE